MRYLSLCSGIEAASVAWQPLGWEPVAFAEHDPESSDGGFAAALLAHRFPSVPNLGPLERITRKKLERLGRIDVIIGGTPCQDLSVAGKRAGLLGARSSLFHHYARIVHAARRVCGTRWALWENVPGAFSSNEGRDFAVVVGALAGCEVTAPEDGWRSEGVVLGDAGLVEWSVLDTQWFGLAQRRDRVFVVADFGDWTARPPLLLEPESLRGDHPPRRETGARVAGTLGARSLGRGSSCGGDGRESFYVAGALTSHHLRGVPEAEAGQLIAGPVLSAHRGGSSAEEAASNQLVVDVADPITATEGKTYTHEGRGNFRLHNVVACFDETQITHPENRSSASPDTAHVAASARPPTIALKDRHAIPEKTDAAATLRALLNAVGAEALSRWGTRALECLQEAEILRSALHGCGVRRAAVEAGRWLVDGALPCAESVPEGPLRTLWIEGPDGRSPQGRQLAEQLAEQLGAPLPFVPSAGAPEIAVRRLTPRECERLFGFPDDWTLVPYRGKPAKDTPRYAALGNSIGIPPLQWIGRRIAAA